VAKHVCRRWLRAVFAAATDESVGAEQNQQILGHESSGGQRVLFDHPSDSQ